MSREGCLFFFFNDTATTEIYTLSLHDALPISGNRQRHRADAQGRESVRRPGRAQGEGCGAQRIGAARGRSEEHTSELQSQSNLVCRLLLEKKNIPSTVTPHALPAFPLSSPSKS